MCLGPAVLTNSQSHYEFFCHQDPTRPIDTCHMPHAALLIDVQDITATGAQTYENYCDNVARLSGFPCDHPDLAKRLVFIHQWQNGTTSEAGSMMEIIVEGDKVSDGNY